MDDIEQHDLLVAAKDLKALSELGEASWKSKAVIDAAASVGAEALSRARRIKDQRQALLNDAPTTRAMMAAEDQGWARWGSASCADVARELETIVARWDDDDVDDYVTMDQAAAIVGKSKRWIEDRRAELPEPDEGGPGARISWRWSRLRPALERVSGRVLKAKFPGSRILPPLEP